MGEVKFFGNLACSVQGCRARGKLHLGLLSLSTPLSLEREADCRWKRVDSMVVTKQLSETA